MACGQCGSHSPIVIDPQKLTDEVVATFALLGADGHNDIDPELYEEGKHEELLKAVYATKTPFAENTAAHDLLALIRNPEGGDLEFPAYSFARLGAGFVESPDNHNFPGRAGVDIAEAIVHLGVVLNNLGDSIPLTSMGMQNTIAYLARSRAWIAIANGQLPEAEFNEQCATERMLILEAIAA